MEKPLVIRILAVIVGLALAIIMSLYLLPQFSINLPTWPLTSTSSTNANSISQLKLPSTYQIKLYAALSNSPRFMTVTELGDIIVSLPKAGKVILLKTDSTNLHAPARTVTLLENLNLPHGVAIANGWLYVAETNAIGRIAIDQSAARTLGHYQRILTGLPNDGGHWTRTVRVGKDGYIYVSIGSSCNACVEKHPWRSSIIRFKPGQTREQVQLFATGLRNSVGFDWSPRDGKLYATDNGRDWLGDHFPPDELNLIEFFFE